MRYCGQEYVLGTSQCHDPALYCLHIPRREQSLLAPHTRTSACGCGPRMGRHTRSKPALDAHKWHLWLALTFLAWYQNNPSLPTLRVPASWKPHSHFGALAPACSCGFGRLIAVGLCTQASLVSSAFSYHPALFWAKKYRLCHHIFLKNRLKPHVSAVFYHLQKPSMLQYCCK